MFQAHIWTSHSKGFFIGFWLKFVKTPVNQYCPQTEKENFTTIIFLRNKTSISLDVSCKSAVWNFFDFEKKYPKFRSGDFIAALNCEYSYLSFVSFASLWREDKTSWRRFYPYLGNLAAPSICKRSNKLKGPERVVFRIR
jgi:hypothetical protein